MIKKQRQIFLCFFVVSSQLSLNSIITKFKDISMDAWNLTKESSGKKSVMKETLSIYFFRREVPAICRKKIVTIQERGDSVKFYIVDVFAENKFEGNQLAVCIPDREINQNEMLKIAREINFSETTFVMSGVRENGGYDVKIFMPDSEIPFGGHPTLGTAYVIGRLLETGQTDKIYLNLKVGQIPVMFDQQNAWMLQNQPEFGSIIDNETIEKILQIHRDDIDPQFPPQVVSTGLPSVIIYLKTMDAVNRCKINHLEYSKLLNEFGNVNLHVFTKETVNPENDLHARVFMFSAGFLEDPATGSSTGNLAGYLLEHNLFNNYEINLKVEQGYSIDRPSLLKIKASKLDGNFSIQVGGRVFAIAEGTWL